MIHMNIQSLEQLSNLPIEITYVGRKKLHETPYPDGRWDADQWWVTVSSSTGDWTFVHFTGFRAVADAAPAPPRKPSIAEVLSTVLNEASAGGTDFMDWCHCFGYLSDSLSAIELYKAHLATARSLQTHFSSETLNQIRELLNNT